jgi:predicted RecA/RadA family phage recombinase
MTAVSDMVLIAYQDTQERVDYTPGASVAAGTPIDMGGNLIGVAVSDLTANKLEALAIKGIFKGRNDAAGAKAVGSKVGVSVANKNITAAGGGDFNLGIVVGADGTAAGDWIYVDINQEATT